LRRLSRAGFLRDAQAAVLAELVTFIARPANPELSTLPGEVRRIAYFPVRSTPKFFQRRGCGMVRRPLAPFRRSGHVQRKEVSMHLATIPTPPTRTAHPWQHPPAGLLEAPDGVGGLLGDLLGVASVTRRGRNQRIARRDGEHDCWHRIVRGAARHCAPRRDGQRQIIAFLLPGDVFASANADDQFAVEAIVDNTVVASFPVPDVEQHAGSSPRLADSLRDLTLAGTYRLQRQILILGRVSAIGKVSAFLLDMADRLADDTLSRFDLPMSRYDIADHLIMSVETVSRSLTSLRGCGAIQSLGRRGVKIVDRMALEDAGQSDYSA
jgi:CRP-like cAMP-binding protein